MIFDNAKLNNIQNRVFIDRKRNVSSLFDKILNTWFKFWWPLRSKVFWNISFLFTSILQDSQQHYKKELIYRRKKKSYLMFWGICKDNFWYTVKSRAVDRSTIQRSKVQGQRSQYIRIKFPLHKESENPWPCF